MPEKTWTCECGARYRVPASAEGHKVRCKHCGRESRMPQGDGEIPLAPVPAGSAVVPEHKPPDVIIEESQPEPIAPLRYSSFWSDVVHSFFFFIEPGSLISFVIVWFFNLLMIVFWTLGMSTFSFQWVMILPLAFTAASVLVFGWLCSYYMRVISETAGDEDELPTTIMGGPFDTVLRPLVQFAATWLCLLLPAIALLAIEKYAAVRLPEVWFLAAGGLAVIMWPMAVLCVSIGGITVFSRADVMVYSVLRTLGPYTVVWILVLINVAIGRYVWQGVTTSSSSGGASLLWRHPPAAGALLSLCLAYSSLVAMQVIGLYYRHFRHRFAWSWE